MSAPDPTPDQVSAYLGEVRKLVTERDELVSSAATFAVDVRVFNAAQDRLAERTPALLAAVEAVLAHHQPGRVLITGALCPRHENHRRFSITGTEAASVRDCPDCAAAVWTSCAGCGPQMPLDSCPARTAISAALLGEVQSGA